MYNNPEATNSFWSVAFNIAAIAAAMLISSPPSERSQLRANKVITLCFFLRSGVGLFVRLFSMVLTAGYSYRNSPVLFHIDPNGRTSRNSADFNFTAARLKISRMSGPTPHWFHISTSSDRIVPIVLTLFSVFLQHTDSEGAMRQFTVKIHLQRSLCAQLLGDYFKGTS